MKFYYSLKYRPPSFCTCPAGWTLEETGTAGSFPLRTDLPRGLTRFGMVSYTRELEERELAEFEMFRVHTLAEESGTP